MRLDVLHIDRSLDRVHRVNIANISQEIGVVGEALQVGLEVRGIHRVKAHQRHEEAKVEPCELIARQVSLVGQALLQLFECIKDILHGHLVGFLAPGKATAIDAIIYLKIICVEVIYGGVSNDSSST